MDNIDQTTHNPDVLSCLANLSNDEVFTPPKLANEVLDLLPSDIWSNSSITFLDPCCKTGVFLREIMIRLLEGLKDEIPDLQERVNHILTKQVFGIAITELTALMTRRTLYCSKNANGKYSICTEFGNNGGNIYYNPNVVHHWKDGKCEQCGASQKEWDREKEKESHAYAFIHHPIEELFNMKFDVIIGNPPYQMSDGSGGNGSSAIPLYHKFVQQAKRLNPKYITMIIPSRWFSGGRNLDEFRDKMLNDKRLKKLTDFLDSKECFPGNNIEGGVCYFLWDSSYRDDCYVTTISQGKSNSVKRPLLEENCETFIRHNEAISILKKIRILKEKPIVDGTLKYNPFGIRSSFKGNEIALSPNDLTLYGLNSKTFINSNSLTKNNEIVSKYKICVGKAYGMGTPPYNVINSPFILNPNEICTETYLVLKTCDNLNEAKNIISYINTRFFRFLVSLKKISQNSTWSTYLLVPTQDFSKPWTDEELYKKYGLTQEEIDYIESMIRPMGDKED